MNNEQYERMGSTPGFIAALDQSGGSTPGWLESYGVTKDQYSGDTEMFDRVHEMRSRIMTSPAFTGQRLLAAILFEDTMHRQVEGRPSADYLWSVKGVVPFLKVDKGLEPEKDGVQVMKPIPGLDDLLAQAVGQRIFGTKMRSFIKLADAVGIRAIVDQQFELASQIGKAGLIPIIEPEVDIHSPQKQQAEQYLRDAIGEQLDRLEGGRRVMLKLSIPTEPDYYRDFIADPRVLRVVALSGGYSRAEACELLARNHGLIASFSRALTEGLRVDQPDDEFNAELSGAIERIYQASIT